MKRLSWSVLAREPFRLFFPVSSLVGAAGVALWPLYFFGVLTFYPGQTHARLMAYGFFGGFIVGFLGTALPRMLSTPPFAKGETAVLLLIYCAMAAITVTGRTNASDVLFLVLLLALGICLARRIVKRGDVPPPSFVLVAIALLCAGAGAVLSLIVSHSETAFTAAALQHLLAYQGFVLLPILGVGAFLLPRFFGAESRQNFPESVTPPPGWIAHALAALLAALLILGSFWLEAIGWVRTGPAVRFVVTLLYIVREVPLWQPVKTGRTPAAILRLAIVFLLLGFVATVFVPAYRVSLLHFTLIGGFAVITLTVATRVIYGHSGQGARLNQPNRWLWVMVGLMLLAMATRVSGDFWPKVLASHYSYGAVIWIVGLILWSFYVLPNVLVSDPED